MKERHITKHGKRWFASLTTRDYRYKPMLGLKLRRAPMRIEAGFAFGVFNVFLAFGRRYQGRAIGA